MKKLAQMTLSSLFVASMFAGCSQPVTSSNVAADDQVQSLAAASDVTLSLDKKDSGTVKKNDTTIKSKNASTAKKDVVDLKLTFKKSLKNDYYPSTYPAGYFQDERQLAQVANYTLSSMNSASTYESGYRIGIAALQMMANDGVYVGRLSFAAANATKSWMNGYKVTAAALQHMAYQKPNSIYEACNLAQKMISATDTYEDGYRAGYAALQIVNTADNYQIKSITGLALNQANAASTYQDAYNVVVYAFRQLSTMR